MAEAAVQRGQVESRVSQAPPTAFVAIALAFCASEDQAVEVVKETVHGTEDILDSEAVQVAQVVLGRCCTIANQLCLPVFPFCDIMAAQPMADTNTKTKTKPTASAKSGLNFNKLFRSFCKQAGESAFVSSFFSKEACK